MATIVKVVWGRHEHIVSDVVSITSDYPTVHRSVRLQKADGEVVELLGPESLILERVADVADSGPRKPGRVLVVAEKKWTIVYHVGRSRQIVEVAGATEVKAMLAFTMLRTPFDRIESVTAIE